MINLSAVAIVQVEAEVALQYARQANNLARKIGERSGEAWSLLYLGHANILVADYGEARSAFRRVVGIRKKLAQENLVPEAVAGLVQVALLTDDLSAANRETEKILAHLKKGSTFEGSEEPLRIYLVCYQTLEKLKDPRSSLVLQEAAQLLEAQISNLHDEKARRMYVENVPWRRAIYEAWQVDQANSN